MSVDRVFTGPHTSECALGCADRLPVGGYSAKGRKPRATCFGVGESHTVGVRQPRARGTAPYGTPACQHQIELRRGVEGVGMKKGEVVVTTWRSVGGLGAILMGWSSHGFASPFFVHCDFCTFRTCITDLKQSVIFIREMDLFQRSKQLQIRTGSPWGTTGKRRGHRRGRREEKGGVRRCHGQRALWRKLSLVLLSGCAVAR